jgi:hypothetical protein
MTARSSGGIIGYLCAIAWIWRSLRDPWTNVGRDRIKEALDSHGSWKFTWDDISEKETFREATGKWNFPRGNKNVSGTPSAGKNGWFDRCHYI